MICRVFGKISSYPSTKKGMKWLGTLFSVSRHLHPHSGLRLRFPHTFLQQKKQDSAWYVFKYFSRSDITLLYKVNAIRKLDVVKNRDVKGSRQLLFFAYALTMKGVTQELESLGRTLQTAFGVIGQTPEEFEALFMDPEESRRRINFAA